MNKDDYDFIAHELHDLCFDISQDERDCIHYIAAYLASGFAERDASFDGDHFMIQVTGEPQ